MGGAAALHTPFGFYKVGIDSMSLTLLIVLATIIGVSMGFSGIGGFLVVPLLMIVADATPAQAVFTALAANLGVTLSNGLFAIGRGQIDWRVTRLMIFGSAIGAFVGAGLLSLLSPGAARYIVAVALAGLGLATLLQSRQRVGQVERALSRLGALLLGVASQVSAVLVGIGGPAVTVPVLAATGSPSDRVVGTALLHGAVVSGLGLIVTGQAGASVDVLVLGVASLIVVSSLVAANWRSKILARVSMRPFVGVLALVGTAVLMFLR